MENQKILSIANAEEDPARRLAYVATFSAAQYYNLIGKKLLPLCPILGETFEITTDEFRYISEHVSYKPKTSACYGESNDYIVQLQTTVEIEQLAKHLEYKQLGNFRVFLKKWQEEYSIVRPSIVFQDGSDSSIYFDCGGKSTIINTKGLGRCSINYHEKGWNDSTYGLIDGYVYDSEEKPIYEMEGKWSGSIWIKNIDSKKIKTMWQCPPNSDDHYSLSNFALKMNATNKELKKVLPPTDSRFRPDRKALSEKNIKLASDEKYRLEEWQRNAWKNRKEKGAIYKPAYFDEEINPITKEKAFKYNGKYWQDRKDSKWQHLPKIY